jgi:hypothetical protein
MSKLSIQAKQPSALSKLFSWKQLRSTGHGKKSGTPNFTIDQFLLVPDEYCLVEDMAGKFDVIAERKCVNWFDDSVWIIRSGAKIFLTDQRVGIPKYTLYSSIKLTTS